MLSDEEKEILNNIKEYMQNDIDKGYHKFVYNDLGSDFKCIDCINAIDNVLNLIEKQSKEIEEAKQKEKKAYIDGTNVAHELCNKYWEDKIKAKIEEWQKEKEFYNKDEDREWGQYNNWDWVDTIINEMQSLLEKE